MKKRERATGMVGTGLGEIIPYSQDTKPYAHDVGRRICIQTFQPNGLTVDNAVKRGVLLTDLDGKFIVKVPWELDGAKMVATVPWIRVALWWKLPEDVTLKDRTPIAKPRKLTPMDAPPVSKTKPRYRDHLPNPEYDGILIDARGYNGVVFRGTLVLEHVLGSTEAGWFVETPNGLMPWFEIKDWKPVEWDGADAETDRVKRKRKLGLDDAEPPCGMAGSDGEWHLAKDWMPMIGEVARAVAVQTFDGGLILGNLDLSVSATSWRAATADDWNVVASPARFAWGEIRRWRFDGPGWRVGVPDRKVWPLSFEAVISLGRDGTHRGRMEVGKGDLTDPTYFAPTKPIVGMTKFIPATPTLMWRPSESAAVTATRYPADPLRAERPL